MGANTGVDKTLVSAGLTASLLSPRFSSGTAAVQICLMVSQATPIPPLCTENSLNFFFEIFLRDWSSLSVLASNHVLKASHLVGRAVLGVGIGMETEGEWKLESGFRDLGWYERGSRKGRTVRWQWRQS